MDSYQVVLERRSIQVNDIIEYIPEPTQKGEPCIVTKVLQAAPGKHGGWKTHAWLQSLVNTNQYEMLIHWNHPIRFIVPVCKTYTLLGIEGNNLVLSTDPDFSVDVSDSLAAEISQQNISECVVTVDCYLGRIYRFRGYQVVCNTLAKSLQRKIDLLEEEIKHYPESDYILSSVKERFDKKEYGL